MLHIIKDFVLAETRHRALNFSKEVDFMRWFPVVFQTDKRLYCETFMI